MHSSLSTAILLGLVALSGISPGKLAAFQTTIPKPLNPSRELAHSAIKKFNIAAQRCEQVVLRIREEQEKGKLLFDLARHHFRVGQREKASELLGQIESKTLSFVYRDEFRLLKVILANKSVVETIEAIQLTEYSNDEERDWDLYALILELENNDTLPIVEKLKTNKVKGLAFTEFAVRELRQNNELRADEYLESAISYAKNEFTSPTDPGDLIFQSLVEELMEMGEREIAQQTTNDFLEIANQVGDRRSWWSISRAAATTGLVELVSKSNTQINELSDRQDREAYYNWDLAKAFAANGDHDAAIKHAALVRHMEYFSQVSNAVVSSLLKADKIEQALTFAKAMEDETFDYIELLLPIAVRAHEIHKKEQAKAILNKCCQLVMEFPAGDVPSFLFESIGYCHFQLGLESKCIKWANEFDDERAKARVLLGIANGYAKVVTDR